jgi:hypothetical protein
MDGPANEKPRDSSDVIEGEVGDARLKDPSGEDDTGTDITKLTVGGVTVRDAGDLNEQGRDQPAVQGPPDEVGRRASSAGPVTDAELSDHAPASPKAPSQRPPTVRKRWPPTATAEPRPSSTSANLTR